MVHAQKFWLDRLVLVVLASALNHLCILLISKMEQRNSIDPPLLEH